MPSLWRSVPRTEPVLNSVPQHLTYWSIDASSAAIVLLSGGRPRHGSDSSQVWRGPRKALLIWSHNRIRVATAARNDNDRTVAVRHVPRPDQSRVLFADLRRQRDQ